MIYRTDAKGFNLVELLITVAIIGILATIAYPSYLNYVNRSHRSDAFASLSQIQLVLERCYSQNFSYTAACTAKPTFPLNSPQNYYTINISNLGTSTYTLTATTRGAQLRDTTCAQMSVNQANVRTAVNNAGVTQTSCWTP
ncbi:type IV pilin protein [Legionella sp. km772]|uniref:type IV pilin protein n=1 Tax=Legionella sp. km772 TaxID=2498111 RepID=UPI000F8D491C|nr:type IV pilin protein [Legionella sp. km772]RUR06995.1 prepilin-type N-terminal cleavage/methylation domain-containing protein [Legionella sp. km772]